jgi:hypothetical protein
MTLDLYSHATSDMQGHAADVLETLVLRTEQRTA